MDIRGIHPSRSELEDRLASHAHLLVTALRCPWPAVLIAFLPSREGTCALSSFRPCHLPGVPEFPTAALAFPLMALRPSGDSPRVPIIHTNRGIRRTTNFLPTEVFFEVSVFLISSKGKLILWTIRSFPVLRLRLCLQDGSD